MTRDGVDYLNEYVKIFEFAPDGLIRAVWEYLDSRYAVEVLSPKPPRFPAEWQPAFEWVEKTIGGPIVNWESTTSVASRVLHRWSISTVPSFRSTGEERAEHWITVSRTCATSTSAPVLEAHGIPCHTSTDSAMIPKASARAMAVGPR